MAERRIIMWVVRIVVYLILIDIAIPIIGDLWDGRSKEISRSLNRMRRAEINIVPEELNAATYYRRAVKVLDEGGFSKICESPEGLPIFPWKSSEFPELAKWVHDHAEVAELIRQGAKQEICRGQIFPYLDKDDSEYPLIEKYDPSLVDYLIASLDLSLGEKGIDGSISQLKNTYRVLKHLEQKEELIAAILVNVREKHSLCPLLKGVLLSEKVTITFCEALITELIQFDKVAESALAKRMAIEIIGYWRLHACFYNNSPELFWYELGGGHIPDAFLWSWYALRWPLRKTLEVYDHYAGVALRLMDAVPYSPQYAELEKELANARQQVMRNPTLRIITPKYIDFSNSDHEANAARRTMLILAGSRLYLLKNGGYPQSLEDLVPDYLPFLPPDPFSDKPFVYNRKDGKITIKSNKEFPEKDETTITFPGKWSPTGIPRLRSGP